MDRIVSNLRTKVKLPAKVALAVEAAAQAVSAASFPWHLGAEADETAVKVYLTLHKLKFALDQMEEIPKSLHPLYDQIRKALAAQEKMRKETYQLREVMRRMAAQYPGS